MSNVWVHKRKYPGRPRLSSELAVFGTDSFGTWLYRARDRKLDRVGIQLLPAGRWWVAWWWIGWNDDPDHRWIAVDICTPPVLDVDGWRYDDLEIDVVAGSGQPVLVLDEDEFEAARRDVPYPAHVATAALRACDEVRLMLEQRAEPFGSIGWARLADAMSVLPGGKQ